MLRKLIAPTLAAVALLAACDSGPTEPTTSLSDDYALVLFGEAGSALQGTLGPQEGPHPFDGRGLCRPFPEELQLTDEQRAEMQALRQAFRADHEDELEALHDIFVQARAAREAGATRMEVREILMQAIPIAQALRPDVQALHEALRAVLTDEQRAWLEANCVPRLPGPMGAP